jgi:hypothetical protein
LQRCRIGDRISTVDAALFGFALIALAIEARTAWVKLRRLYPGKRGASLIAGIWVTVEQHVLRWWVVGIAIAPVLLYILPVAAFALGGR